jgi:hypothetical protein
VWIPVPYWLIFRALRAQMAEPDPMPTAVQESATVF